jgi:hypothetical protein
VEGENKEEGNSDGDSVTDFSDIGVDHSIAMHLTYQSMDVVQQVYNKGWESVGHCFVYGVWFAELLRPFAFLRLFAIGK